MVPSITLLSLFLLAQGYHVANGQEEYAFVPMKDTISGVPVTTEARYQCSITNQWTSKNHPGDYPENPTWNSPLFVTHSENYSLWQRGKVSSPGLTWYAQSGTYGPLTVEALSSGEEVRDIEIGDHFTVESGAPQTQEVLDFAANAKQPFMSTIARISPSPDWFSGFSALDLRQNMKPTASNPNVTQQMWYREFYVDTYPFTAGTLSGNNYEDPGVPLDPIQNIRQFTVETEPARTNNLFVSSSSSTTTGTDAQILPVARWSCKLLNEAEFTLVDDTDALVFGDGSVLVNAEESLSPTTVGEEDTDFDSTLSPSDATTTTETLDVEVQK